MHLSLRMKFVLYFVIFMTASFLLMAKLLFDRQHEALLGEMQKRLAVEATNLSHQAREAMETNDDLSVLTSLIARRETEDFIDAAVLYSDGTVFAHSDVRQVGLQSDVPIEADNLQRGLLYVQGSRGVSDASIQVWAPVISGLSGKDERIGLVYLTLSQSPLLQTIKNARWAATRLGAIFVLLGIIGTALITRTITRPIGQLVEGVRRIAAGDLNYKMQIKRSDEIGLLSDSFDAMTDQLEMAQQELLKQQLYEKELEVAGKIQAALLPKRAPESGNFDVAAHTTPARVVGGDFFDYIQTPHGTTFLVADVAGKGVSAGLVMTAVRSAARTVFQQTQSPREALSVLNELILRDFDRKTFVTMLILALDADAKCLRISNAGHPPILHYQADTQECKLLSLRGAAVGILPGKVFEEIIEEREVQLSVGDLVVGYSDGVTEAHNAKEELYGEERLRVFGERFAHLPPTEFLMHLQQELEHFSQGMDQFDDITALALRPTSSKTCNNPEPSDRINLKGVSSS